MQSTKPTLFVSLINLKAMGLQKTPQARLGPEYRASSARKSITKHAFKAVWSRQSSGLYVVLKPKKTLQTVIYWAPQLPAES